MIARASLLIALLAAFCATFARADDVTRQVQEELRKRNLFFGDIDGRPSSSFSAALSTYQQRKGFAPSGTLTDETLGSFGLRPPPSSPPTWPDVPVLKSDESVRVAAVEPPALPAEAKAEPPPPAATADDARLFVERYLLSGQNNDAAVEAAFYADHADYFNQGKVDRRFIQHDIEKYDARWPKRFFSLEDSVKVMPTDAPARVVVEVTYRFDVRGRKYSVQGRIGTTYTLSGQRPEDWRIVRVKEERLKR